MPISPTNASKNVKTRDTMSRGWQAKLKMTWASLSQTFNAHTKKARVRTWVLLLSKYETSWPTEMVYCTANKDLASKQMMLYRTLLGIPRTSGNAYGLWSSMVLQMHPTVRGSALRVQRSTMAHMQFLMAQRGKGATRREKAKSKRENGRLEFGFKVDFGRNLR